MKALLITLFYQPLYNGLVFLLGSLPFADVGLAVILFTIFVKLVLMPLSKKSLETQVKLKKLEPELNEIKKQHKDVAIQGTKIMEIYKANNINPFSGFLLILIQIPIIFSLYYIFLRSGLPTINTSLLYSFVPIPANIDMHLLGRFNLAEKSIILALLAGITQFLVTWRALPPQEKKVTNNGEFSLKDELAKSLNVQMKYIMPIVIVFIAYSLSAVVALYWTTSNAFAVTQEYFIRKRIYSKENKPNK